MKLKTLILTIALTATCVGAAQSVYPGQHNGKLKVTQAVAPLVESFDLSDVRLLPGRVHDNMQRDSMWMANIDINRLLHSFYNNAGVFAGLEGGYESVKKYGGWESLDCDLRGHTTGHLMSAYALMYAATGSEMCKLKGDSIVAGLQKVQQTFGNGYVSAFPEELINRNMRGEAVWAPWYTLHKILAGLIDQYLYADNDTALEVAVRVGEWAYTKLQACSEATREKMLRNEFGGVNEAFYNLYAATANEHFLWLARFFYHNAVIDPLKAGNVDFGTKHANTFIPKVIGEMRNYELTGSNESLALGCRFFNEVTAHHIFANGSCSQKEHFFDTSKFSNYLNGYTGETCCTYNMLKLARHIYSYCGDADVIDYYERALYNHILAQQDPESGMVCYFLPMLSGAYKVYSTPEQSFWCCVGSGFESHAKYAESIYWHSGAAGARTLWVNLFIPSTLNWREAGLRVTQTTDFPSSEVVSLTVDEAPADAVNLKLRVPRWTSSPRVKLNGRLMRLTVTDGYITLKRKWHAGDRVEIVYPMYVRLERTPDNASRGALMCGPVLLAGQLGTDGMSAPAPFSDPTVRNDYYTYDYHIPQGLKTSLHVPADGSATLLRRIDNRSMTYLSAEGDTLRPLFDTNHQRYVVYWQLIKSEN